MNNLQLLYNAADAKELQFIIESLCSKQRSLLINLLKEEKESLEPHVNQNEWAYERYQLVISLLSTLGSSEED